MSPNSEVVITTPAFNTIHLHVFAIILTLHTNFRPPSAGPYELPKATKELWDQNPQGAHGIPSEADRPKWFADQAAGSGVQYRLMMDHIKKVLADPKRVCPAYEPKDGFEVAGFVWLQGFNDLVDSTKRISK
jgi:alpha-galactosidase